MPGLVGIVSFASIIQCETQLALMAKSMKHESFYTSDTISVPGMGVYAGWVGLEATPATQIISNAIGDIILILSGECYRQSAVHHSSDSCTEPGVSALRWILDLYEREGPQFVVKLNGLFSGVIVDQRRRQTFLFNDRYGVNRLYLAETPTGCLFASEVKAILRVCPEFRTFDPNGVAEFLSLGCCVEGRTLFRNVSLLPGGSLWTFSEGHCQKGKYFSPETWESQPELSEEEFEVQFQDTFRTILPQYFLSEPKLAISLTGGLDTRMIMACLPASRRLPLCYTYTGQTVDTLDARLAKRIAAAKGLDFAAIRLDVDFLSDFSNHVDQTVYITDGCSGLTGAHEIYMSRKARQFSSIRVTGNYGGEVFRGVSTFQPSNLANGLLNSDLHASIANTTKRWAHWKKHQITFAAFQEIPWNLAGTLLAGRSQLNFRTPYLDNQLVALAYQTPESLRRSRRGAIRLVRENDPSLANIPTDKAHLGDFSALGRLSRRMFAEATCKLDYLYSEGLPSGLSPAEPLLRFITSSMGLLGLHKHLQYRSWFRHELASYVTARLADVRVRQYPFWQQRFLDRLGSEHISGRKNYVSEINAVLTLDAVQRLLLDVR